MPILGPILGRSSKDPSNLSQTPFKPSPDAPDLNTDLDGLLVAPHGAGVAENAPDMDGSWLRELRSRVGPRMPIVGTLDLHANLTETMVRATNALVAYRTNPHLDQRERGLDAARLLARMLRGEIRPTQEAAFPPLAINIERQGTDGSPCGECYEALLDMLADHRVLSASLLLGFPYADVREMGASVLVVTDDVPDLARRLADDFAEYLRLRRRAFVGELISVDAAIERAVSAAKPVCLLDMGDNVGGGAPGDGTLLLAADSRYKGPNSTMPILGPILGRSSKDPSNLSQTPFKPSPDAPDLNRTT